MDYGFDQLDEFDPLPKVLETAFGEEDGLCGVEIALGLMDDQWLSP
jgi:hypothetical protein